MSTFARSFAAPRNSAHAADDAAELSRLEARLPPLLSVIAGMVDLTGFFSLGHIFTAHVIGNLVVAAAAAVHGGPAPVDGIRKNRSRKPPNGPRRLIKIAGPMWKRFSTRS